MCQENSISCIAIKRKLHRHLFIVAVCLCWLVLGNVQYVGKLCLLSFHNKNVRIFILKMCFGFSIKKTFQRKFLILLLFCCSSFNWQGNFVSLWFLFRQQEFQQFLFSKLRFLFEWTTFFIQNRIVFTVTAFIYVSLSLHIFFSNNRMNIERFQGKHVDDKRECFN